MLFPDPPDLLTRLDQWADRLPRWLSLLLALLFFTTFWACLVAVWIAATPNH